MEYRVEEDLYARDGKYKIMWYNKPFDLWLTLNTDKYNTEKEADQAVKKLLVKKKR
jgi:hypothetical protein